MGKVKQLWLLTAVAVIAVFAGGYFLLISPKAKQAGEIRTDAAAARTTNRSLETQIAMLKSQAKQLPREQARLAELARKIPNNPALPSLVRTLSDNADAASVDLVSLAPAKPTTVSAAVAAAPVTAAGTAQEVLPPTLAMMPIEVEARGYFGEIQQFIGSLEDMQRAWLVGDVEVAPTCRPPDGGRPPDDCDPRMLTLKIGARVFMTTAARPAVPAVTTTEGN